MVHYAQSYWIALRVRTLSLAVTGTGAGLLAAEYHSALALPATAQGLVLLLFSALIVFSNGARGGTGFSTK